MDYGNDGWEARRELGGKEKEKQKEQETIELKSHLAETPCKFSAFVFKTHLNKTNKTS